MATLGLLCTCAMLRGWHGVLKARGVARDLNKRIRDVPQLPELECAPRLETPATAPLSHARAANNSSRDRMRYSGFDRMSYLTDRIIRWGEQSSARPSLATTCSFQNVVVIRDW